jgi:hypothetical protein
MSLPAPSVVPRALNRNSLHSLPSVRERSQAADHVRPVVVVDNSKRGPAAPEISPTSIGDYTLIPPMHSSRALQEILSCPNEYLAA